MPLERIISHFQTESETIASLARGKIIYANNSDKGTSREDILLDFIDRHLPNRFKIIKGGLIFDSRGNESNQIDLIITNDLTLQFNEFAGHRFGKSFNCLEGCIAAISVKSRLDKDGIIDSLKNISSIPLLEEDFMANPLVANLHDLMKQVPYKIVFAYRGDSHDSILGHLQDYKTQNGVKVENLPDLIIVNNSYYIWKIGPKGGTDSEGKKYEYGDMIYEPNYENIGGMAMLYMLTQVQKMTNLSSVVIFNFNKYFDAMDRIVRGNVY